jgi:PleD family two-component response regulator
MGEHSRQSRARLVVCQTESAYGAHDGRLRSWANARNGIRLAHAPRVTTPPVAAPSVLIVDPFSDEREMYAEYFQAVGFAVQEAADLDSALTALADVRPDAVIVRSGPSLQSVTALIASMRASDLRRRTPLIVLTSDVSSERTTRLTIDCDLVLLVPTIPDQLLNQLRGLLSV